MRTDRAELTNLIDVEQDIAQRMRHQLLTELAKYHSQEPDFEVIEENMREILDELRALGYLQ